MPVTSKAAFATTPTAAANRPAGSEPTVVTELTTRRAPPIASEPAPAAVPLARIEALVLEPPLPPTAPGAVVIAPQRVRRRSPLQAALGAPGALLRAVAGRSAPAPAAHEAPEIGAERPTLRRLRLSEQTFGPNHPDVAMASHMLAAEYQLERRYDEAEALYRRALAIRERALGPNHPEVALTLEDLAALYCEERRGSDAEPLLARAMRVHESVLGPDHPSLARKREEFEKLLAAASSLPASGAGAAGP
jgi:tetratricopeptide (TPR) repeat protein